jgi:hypothetical protein
MGSVMTAHASPLAPARTVTDPDGPLDPLALYASAIDTSDYIARVVPPIRAIVPAIGDLVDIGAGGGQLGHALLPPGARWTAIEPSPTMRARLGALSRPPAVIPYGWDDPAVSCPPGDTVLAATMPGYLTDPARFLARCRQWSRRHIVWLVPAQAAPRGLILAACLPRDWHREDETPGIDRVLPGLGDDRPDHHVAVDWTFSLVLPDLPRFAAFQADRLGWSADDARRPALLAHLSAQAEPVPGGLRLSCHRRSAILVWTLS